MVLCAINGRPCAVKYSMVEIVVVILKHDPTFHLATARTSELIIYSDIARVISLCIIIIINIIMMTIIDIPPSSM